ncbi:MAG: hypothetical protein EXR18_01955 [Flavobacteriaceae bacterium]|nr:hypothetical protein [Flavobacteriaceae bacterium]
MYLAERGQRALKRMTKELDLNEAQQKEMGILLLEAESKKGTFENEPSREDRKAMKNKIRKILT